MRTLAPVLLAGFLSLSPLTATAADAAVEPPATTPTATTASSNDRLYAMGAGAIVGVVAFNMLTYPWGSVPFVAGSLAATPVDIALGSRLLAALTGGAGGLIAHYWYETQTAAEPAQ